MTWTYRVVCDDTGSLRIAEVYTGLTEHFEGGISWTADPIAPIGDDRDEITRDIERMLQACMKPVIDEATLRETVKNETG